MLIDAIFDRYRADYEDTKKFGMDYTFDAVRFAEYAHDGAEIFDCYKGVVSALESGDENRVKMELCKYVFEQEYNAGLCDYILHREWTVDTHTEPRKELTEEDERIIEGVSRDLADKIKDLYKKKRKKRAG